MGRFLRLIPIALLAALASSVAVAADVPDLVLTAEEQRYPATPHLSVLFDPTGDVCVEDILNERHPGEFRGLGEQGVNLGFERSAVWVRLVIDNLLSEDGLYYLVLDHPLLDYVTLHILEPDGVRIHETGDRTRFDTRLVDARKLIFPLEVTRGEPVTLYLRVVSAGSVNLSMEVLAEAALFQHLLVEYTLLALYYGALLMLVVYNLYHFWRLRDRNALYYVFFIGAYMLFQLALNGISFQFFWPHHPWWANINLPLFLSLAYFAGVLFTRSILDTARHTPRLHRIMGWLLWLGVLGMILALAAPYTLAIHFSVGLTYTLFIFIAAGVIASFQGYRPAYYYTLAWGVSLCMMIVFGLTSFGLLPVNFFTTWATQFGSAWDAIILAFAISDRFYLLQEETREVQARYSAELELTNQELNTLNDELESRVSAGLADLRASNEQLREEAEVRRRAEAKAEAANRAKSAFLANMSHEIRTPMNAVVGFAHLLVGTALSDRQRDFVRKIDSAAQALLHLINDILDLSKVESGHLKLHREAFRLDAVVESALDLVRVDAERKGLELVVEHAGSRNCIAMGDPARVRQVLVNLLSNAVKFTQQGRVMLSARCEPISDHQVRITLSVTDTGIGIEPEQIKLLFQPFTQADASITRRFGGTGLGLAISRKLAERMGGEIRVQSTPGEGSCFTLALTAPRGGTQDSLPVDVDTLGGGDRSAEAESLAGFRVLVVEDQPVNQELMIALLQAAGAEVAVAADGRAALAYLHAVPRDAVDLVLMDLQMPVMDGYEATRRIRGEAGYSDLPIVAMSAHALAEERAKSLEVGMDEHLTKPVDVQELNRVLSRFGKKEPKQELAPDQQPSPVAGLDLAAGLARSGGNSDLHRRLLDRFLDGAEVDFAALRAALDSKDRAAARQQAHAMAGVALNLGLVAVGDAARVLESALKDQDAVSIAQDSPDRLKGDDLSADRLQVSLGGLRAALDAAQARIQALGRSDGSPDGTMPSCNSAAVPDQEDGAVARDTQSPEQGSAKASVEMASEADMPVSDSGVHDLCDDPVLHRYLGELAELLRCNNFRARQAFDALSRHVLEIRGPEPLRDLLEPVGKHIDRLEFAAAHSALVAVQVAMKPNGATDAQA